MPKNDYTTLISMRLENETLDAINKFFDGLRYYNRSSLINLALRQLFVNCNEQQVWDFLHLNLFPKSCDTKN